MKTKHKIVIISDTHTMHKDYAKKFELPPADFIIHCGDITGRGSQHSTQLFLKWFSSLYQYDNKIFIAGNHDWLFDTYPDIAKEILSEFPNIHYLQDSGVEIWGLKFWGSPVTKPFNNWAFNRPEEKLKQHWEAIPDDTDILITHGAPNGILDLAWSGSKEHTGSESLYSEVINRIKPKVHCFGHIHEQYGQEEILGTKFVNASSVDFRYNPVNPPIVIEVEV